MKYLYHITNIFDSKGKLLSGWTILVKRASNNEYQTEIYYKDNMLYWVSQTTRDLEKLIDETINKIGLIIKYIPEDALNSKQEWSHVKSFGNYGEREFVMLLKCNGRATLRRFCKTSNIFNHITNFIPDSIDMLNENWCKYSNNSDTKINNDSIKNSYLDEIQSSEIS